jgi:hypothetical protein
MKTALSPPADWRAGAKRTPTGARAMNECVLSSVRHCEERSDAAIHATAEFLETLKQIARLQLDCHAPAALAMTGIHMVNPCSF